MQRIISGAKRLFRKKNHHRSYESNALSRQSLPRSAFTFSDCNSVSQHTDFETQERIFEASYSSSSAIPQSRLTSKKSALLYRICMVYSYMGTNTI